MRDSSKRVADSETHSAGKHPGRKFLSKRSQSWATKRACLRELDPNTKILVGSSGDHPLVLKLLSQAKQHPLAEDFQSRLDEPTYQPSDRVLLYRKEQLIGHVRVSKQIGWFHQHRLPIAMFQDFITLPEYVATGFDDKLLESAEQAAVQEGSMLGLVRTNRPEWFEQRGWSCCYGQGNTRANTMSILSHFDAQAASQTRRPLRPLQKRQQTVEIRSWRHVELDSLIKIYESVASKMWGTLYRSEETWQWLVGRKAQDQILIAVDNVRTKTREDDEGSSTAQKIVGYAIVRDSCIVEMLTIRDYSHARPMLVARACRDAIDRDHHFVSLLTPANDPMHEFLITAGGQWVSDLATLEGKWMLKLLTPSRWCERLYPLLQQRAEQAGISRPVDIDFACEDERQRLMLTRRSSRLESIGDHGETSDVRCNQRVLQDLLTGNLSHAEALKENRLEVCCKNTMPILTGLFPPELFWQSPFPLLRI